MTAELGGPRLTWGRLRAFIEHLPEGRESALRRSLDPDDKTAWSTGEHLLAYIADVLVIANWQRSDDGAKGRKKPRPLPRPGDEAELAKKNERMGAAAKQWQLREERRRQQAAPQQPPVA